MPTKTFLNLQKNKQDTIIDASLKEFKRVLIKDASINKIIKDANISRGSFYTYFTDINDLYLYSINSYKKDLMKLIQNTLIETNGNLIESAKLAYDKIIDFCEKDKQLFKNIFLNFNYNISLRNEIYYTSIENKYEIIEIISKIKTKDLNIKNEEELFIIIDMISSFVIHGLIEIFLDNKSKDIIKEKINKQLEILKRGIHKED